MRTVLGAYRADMRRACGRIRAAASATLQTRFGIVEYVDRGVGVPLLVSHGVLGCHVDGVDGHWSTLPGPGFRVIAPARFGYFSSTLPADATPADQADAYAALLDHLGVDHAVVVGYSAGTASVLEFARRHRDRVVALILASARLGGGITLSRRLELLLRVAYSSDLLFWKFKQVLPTAYARMMGAPKGYRPTPAEARTLAGSASCSSRSNPAATVPSSTGSSPTCAPTGSATGPHGPHPDHQRGRRPAGPVPVRRRRRRPHPFRPTADHRTGWTPVPLPRHPGPRTDRRIPQGRRPARGLVPVASHPPRKERAS